MTANARVLLAEDDAEMRRVIVDALERDGHSVHAVADGLALLIRLAQNDRFHWQSVDLVIADVRMPICSGLQALETVRAAGAPVPFLLITAFSDAEVKRRARKAGGRLLDKPFAIDELRRAVDELVASRQPF